MYVCLYYGHTSSVFIAKPTIIYALCFTSTLLWLVSPSSISAGFSCWLAITGFSSRFGCCKGL